MDGVDEVRQIDDTHLHWVTSVGPATREFDATVTEQHPDERVAWKSDDGPEHAGVVTFHRLDDQQTKVTVQMSIDPEGFVENVADKASILDHRVKGDLKRFKDFIESRGTETGAWRGDVDAPGRARRTDEPPRAQRSRGGMTLWVPSHHGCELTTCRTGTPRSPVVMSGARRRRASSTTWSPRSSIGPPGHRTTSGWSNSGTLMPPTPRAWRPRTGPRGRGR